MPEERQDKSDVSVWPPPPVRPAPPADARSFVERVSLWLLAGLAAGFGLGSSGLSCLLRHWTREPVEWLGALTHGLIVAGGMLCYLLWLRGFLQKRRRR